MSRDATWSKMLISERHSSTEPRTEFQARTIVIVNCLAVLCRAVRFKRHWNRDSGSALAGQKGQLRI